MMTVGHPGPGTIGMPCMLRSASRAAGIPPILTVRLPIEIALGTGDTHGMPPGMLLATAAGIPPIKTVKTPAAGVIGPPTCGTSTVIRGQSATSPTRRAGPVGMAPRYDFGVSRVPLTSTESSQLFACVPVPLGVSRVPLVVQVPESTSFCPGAIVIGVRKW
jgi:hypothetical protein